MKQERVEQAMPTIVAIFRVCLPKFGCTDEASLDLLQRRYSAYGTAFLYLRELSMGIG